MMCWEAVGEEKKTLSGDLSCCPWRISLGLCDWRNKRDLQDHNSIQYQGMTPKLLKPTHLGISVKYKGRN